MTIQSKPVAVIDIGSTSIRMTIGQAGAGGAVRTLDHLQQVVSLGKDTFTNGKIARSTIEECIFALKSFQRFLGEYGIPGEQVRVVATTAVREADNRDAFIDRVYVATGMNVEPLDDVEIARCTFLSFHCCANTPPALAQSNALITEIGGGNTEVLYLQNGTVAFARNYRLGSMRLREMLETFRTPAGHLKELTESYVQQTVDLILKGLQGSGPVNLVAIGNEARFVADRFYKDRQWEGTVEVPAKAFSKLTDQVLGKAENELVRKYHLSFPEAETLGSSLYFYTRLARALSIESLYVSDISMRKGVMAEMARPGVWAEQFRNQVLRPAQEIGRKYLVNEAHAAYVSRMCRLLFQALKNEHKLDTWHEMLLTIAAQLHDCGTFVSTRSHHKHSYYLISNSELFGLGRNDTLMVALIARYHRRASPRAIHEGYALLSRQDRVVVAKLAAILRVADALDGANSQRLRDVRVSLEPGLLVVTVPNVDDLAVEQLALQNKGPMFEEVYGMKVALRGQL